MDKTFSFELRVIHLIGFGRLEAYQNSCTRNFLLNDWAGEYAS